MLLHYREDNQTTASLKMGGWRLRWMTPLKPTVVDISHAFAPERAAVEAFIGKVYKESYGADIHVDYPILMSVRDAEGKILAAVGFRYAHHEPLFLEQYTRQPLEHMLQCPRSRLVEIGNLASAGQGASIFLFAALSSYLHHKGIRYAAITGTQYIHDYLHKLGLQPQELCKAEIVALQPNGQNWGSYYANQPRVLVGSVQDGVHQLGRAVGATFQETPKLYSRLHVKA